MDNGNRIITILGVVAAVIFIGTILVSIGFHYSTKKHHEARFKQFESIAVTGSPYEEVSIKLKDAGFTILSQDVLVSGGRSIVYAWDEKKADKRFQQKMLGVPVAARVNVDQNGKLTSCEGLMIRPGGEE